MYVPLPAGHPLIRSDFSILTLLRQVFLAMEERDPNATSAAATLESAFRHKFRGMQHTVHPGALPGEEPGKSSNISWAARHVHEKYHEMKNWSDVLLTVMDSTSKLLYHFPIA